MRPLPEKGRGGYRMGHGQVIDHMFMDGLEDAYERGKLMGVFADDTARKLQITRQDQDSYALASLSRAQEATKNGNFKSEIVPVTFKTKEGETAITEDENPKKARPDKIPTLNASVFTRGHGHGGECQLYFRWVCGFGDYAEVRGAKARPEDYCRSQSARNTCAKTGRIYYCADWCH